MNDLQINRRTVGGDAEVYSDCQWSEAGRKRDDTDEAGAFDPGDRSDVGRSEVAEKIRAAQSDKKTANMISFTTLLQTSLFMIDFENN